MAELLRLTGIHKRFGGVHALKGAEMTIARSGVVHALVGENGSGKSTLLGVLSGQLRPDRGEIILEGAPVSFSSPVGALGHGIAMVSQETAVAPDLSVAENILLGRRMVRRWSGISTRATRAKAQRILAQLQLDYDPSWIVGQLRPDQRQMVEIARALSTDARILILDEPTSSLTDDEVERLFEAIRQLKRAGVATVFVSHRLPEIFAVSDEVTILRDGQTVAQAPISQYDARSLVDVMVGTADVHRQHASPANVNGATRSRALRVRGLQLPPVLQDIELEVGAGEIVGLAGLVGAGRSELLEALFGVRQAAAGHIEIGGEPFRPGSPRASIVRGLGFLPPDRKTQGLVLSMSVASNLTMVQTMEHARAAALIGVSRPRRR